MQTLLAPQILAAARTTQNAIMTSTLRIERGTATETPESFTATKTWTLIWEGPGRLQPAAKTERAQIAAEQITEDHYVAAIPWDTEPPQIGDRVTVIAAADPNMVGQHYIVERTETGSSYITARRFHLAKGT